MSLAGFFGSPSSGVAQQLPIVNVEREGDTFYVRARASVAVDPRVAWDTITDYEHMRDFLPNIERSKVIARTGTRNAKEPFFLWVHYFDPHFEYLHHDQFNFGPSDLDRYDADIAFTFVGLARHALPLSLLRRGTEMSKRWFPQAGEILVVRKPGRLDRLARPARRAQGLGRFSV